MATTKTATKTAPDLSDAFKNGQRKRKLRKVAVVRARALEKEIFEVEGIRVIIRTDNILFPTAGYHSLFSKMAPNKCAVDVLRQRIWRALGKPEGSWRESTPAVIVDGHGAMTELGTDTIKDKRKLIAIRNTYNFADEKK